MNQNFLFEDFKIIGTNTAKYLESFKDLLLTSSGVLISGETGTGKELAARWIHFNDPKRNNNPFVKITIPNIGENIFESEIFGYEKGAFTGAVSSKKGLIEVCEEGSLFFDEIENASPSIQSKLLQLFEDRLYRKVGDTSYRKTNARFIVAANKDLYEEVQKNSFRQDLYFRLAVIELKMPPLRERGRDILEIANFYIEKYSKELGRNVRLLTQKDLPRLCSYPWPGNVRELKNFIERSVVFSKDSRIDLSKLEKAVPPIETAPEEIYTYREYIRLKEQELFVKALSMCNGNVEQTASLIKMSVPFVYKKIKELGIRL
ncbi:MAG TPA: sigma-54 dependent transcriptional regulator [Acetivibrio sp.]|nr:sigma-54 dependent transcriptional regulator [Acetivibrio sp.]